MPRRSGKSRAGARTRSRGRKSGTGVVKSLVKAISDLKVDTQIRGSPRVPDIPRMFVKSRKVFTVNQTFTFASITVTTADHSGAVYFLLNLVPNYVYFQNLFDTYRVEQLTVRFVPLGTLPVGSGGFNPLLTVIDYDDAAGLSSAQAAQGYDNCQETPLGQYVERTLTPRVATAAYSGTTFTSYASQRPWCDTSSAAIYWYGVKYYTVGSTAAITGPLYSIEVDCVISFVSVR